MKKQIQPLCAAIPPHPGNWLRMIARLAPQDGIIFLGGWGYVNDEFNYRIVWDSSAQFNLFAG